MPLLCRPAYLSFCLFLTTPFLALHSLMLGLMLSSGVFHSQCPGTCQSSSTCAWCAQSILTHHQYPNPEATASTKLSLTPSELSTSSAPFCSVIFISPITRNCAMAIAGNFFLVFSILLNLNKSLVHKTCLISVLLKSKLKISHKASLCVTLGHIFIFSTLGSIYLWKHHFSVLAFFTGGWADQNSLQYLHYLLLVLINISTFFLLSLIFRI